MRTKVRMSWLFAVSKVKESTVLQSDFMDSPLIFLMRNFWLIRLLALTACIFQLVFISIQCYVLHSLIIIRRNEIEEKKGVFTQNKLLSHQFIQKINHFFAELAMSRHWSALLCARGAWGSKPTGQVRVKKFNFSSGNTCSVFKVKSWLLITTCYIMLVVLSLEKVFSGQNFKIPVFCQSVPTRAPYIGFST